VIFAHNHPYQRDAHEHGDEAALINVFIPITLDHSHIEHNVLVLRLAASGFKSSAAKGGIRFQAYADKPASEVCAAYLQLCRRFVDDFLRDHKGLI